MPIFLTYHLPCSSANFHQNGQNHRHIYEAISTLPGNVSPASSWACRKESSLSLDCCNCISVQAPAEHETGRRNSLQPLTKNSLLQPFHSTVKGLIRQLSIKGLQVCALPAQHVATRLAEKAGERPVPAAVIKNVRPGPAWSRLTVTSWLRTLINRTRMAQAGKDLLGTQHSAPRAG